MVAFILTLVQFARGIRQSLRDPEFRSIFFLVVGQLALGTLFYRQAEGWGYLDSLYFCVITLATVGYGDLTPTTAPGKIFTMVYIIFCIGLLVAFANKVASTLLAQREARVAGRHQRDDHHAGPPGAPDA